METDVASKPPPTEDAAATADQDKDKELAPAKEPDVGPYQLENPTRVVPAQAKFVNFKKTER